jgi:uncharacterized membrane protein HdeD (DUF308 family)
MTSMTWLEQNGWWGLAFMTVVIALFGVTDMMAGASNDPAIPLSLTGLTLAELEAESAAGYRLVDLYTRGNGLTLVLGGLLATAVLVFAYRRHRRWAWWTMWLLPAWAASVPVFYLIVGLAPGQPPPPPMISGPIFALFAVAILLAGARPFFRFETPAAPE